MYGRWRKKNNVNGDNICIDDDAFGYVKVSHSAAASLHVKHPIVYV